MLKQHQQIFSLVHHCLLLYGIAFANDHYCCAAVAISISCCISKLTFVLPLCLASTRLLLGLGEWRNLGLNARCSTTIADSTCLHCQGTTHVQCCADSWRICLELTHTPFPTFHR